MAKAKFMNDEFSAKFKGKRKFVAEQMEGELVATVLAGFFFLVVLVMLTPGMIALKLLDWVYGKLYWRES